MAVGRAIRHLQPRRPAMRLGLVGLGAGTLAAYARPSDLYTFYEINPEIWRFADAEGWKAALGFFGLLAVLLLVGYPLL